MSENSKKMAISKYANISAKTLLILSGFTILPIIIKSIFCQDMGFVYTIVSVIRLYFNIVSLTIGIIFTMVALDIEELNNLDISHKEFKLLEMLIANDFKAKLEIIILLTSIYMLMLIGMLGKWLTEIFEDEIPLPDNVVIFMVAIFFITFIIWIYLRHNRRRENNICYNKLCEGRMAKKDRKIEED